MNLFFTFLPGLVPATISTTERRFSYTSTTSGDISLAFNLGAVLAILPFSYLAGRPGASKLRYIAAGLFIMGIGSALYCLPHFLSKPPKNGNAQTGGGICTTGALEDEIETAEGKTPYHMFLIAGHFLHGAGKN
jgi:organic anion transporter 4A